MLHGKMAFTDFDEHRISSRNVDRFAVHNDGPAAASHYILFLGVVMIVLDCFCIRRHDGFGDAVFSLLHRGMLSNYFEYLTLVLPRDWNDV